MVEEKYSIIRNIQKNYREGRYTIRSMNLELVFAAKSLFVSKNKTELFRIHIISLICEILAIRLELSAIS